MEEGNKKQGFFNPVSMAQDDRILPETRWLAAVIIPFLVVAAWLRNRTRDRGTVEPGELTIPPVITHKWWKRVAGTAVFALFGRDEAPRQPLMC